MIEPSEQWDAHCEMLERSQKPTPCQICKGQGWYTVSDDAQPPYREMCECADMKFPSRYWSCHGSKPLHKHRWRWSAFLCALRRSFMKSVLQEKS